jgi:hypothetical protein
MKTKTKTRRPVKAHASRPRSGYISPLEFMPAKRWALAAAALVASAVIYSLIFAGGVPPDYEFGLDALATFLCAFAFCLLMFRVILWRRRNQ